MITGPYQPSTLRFYKERMLVVLGYIQQNLDTPLELDDLARRGGLSPFHFHRVFRGMTGEPLMAHVRRLRLERAALRLRTTTQSIIQVALDAGYDSHEAFTRAFRQAFGVAPSSFRRDSAPGRVLAQSGIHFGDGRPPRHFRTTTHRSMKVTIEKREPLRVAYVRHTGPYSECGKAWDKLCGYMGKHGCLGAGCQILGVSYDDPESTPPAKIRYDACVSVDESFKPVGEIGVQLIAGGDYARVTHHGPYEQLSRTYAQLMGQWLPRSGRQARDVPCFEVYLNDPASTAPADLLVDIYLPLVDLGSS